MIRAGVRGRSMMSIAELNKVRSTMLYKRSGGTYKFISHAYNCKSVNYQLSFSIVHKNLCNIYHEPHEHFVRAILRVVHE